VPTLPALGRHLPRRAVQHRVLCAFDDDDRASDGAEGGRFRPYAGRRASLFEPFRTGAGATSAQAARLADDAAQSGGAQPLRFPLRGFRARRLCSGAFHQGADSRIGPLTLNAIPLPFP
jgi:hypothetical protein